MKNRLLRPSSALFPVAMLAAHIIVPSGSALRLLVFYFAHQLVSLCAVDSFRNAAAREPGLRRVDKRFWGSFTMLLLSFVLCALACMRISNGNITRSLLFTAVPWLILIEQLFEERLFTLNRGPDGNILSLISNALLFVGLILDGTNGAPSPFEMFYPLAAAGAGALIAAFTCLKFAPLKGFSLVPRNLPFAPVAMLQTLLYPAAMLALCALNGWKIPSLPGFLLGWLLWRLNRTVCRRSADESRMPALLVIAVSAAAVALAAFLPGCVAGTSCVLAALLCVAAVFLMPSVRVIAGTLLTAAGFACVMLKLPFAAYIAPACGLIAVILNLKNAFLKKI